MRTPLALFVALPAGLLAQDPAVRGVPRSPVPVQQQVLPQRPPAPAERPVAPALVHRTFTEDSPRPAGPRRQAADPFAGTGLVLTDVPSPGQPLWALAAGYKASFDRQGFTFFPCLPHAQHHDPLRFHLHAASVAGEPLPLGTSEPVLEGCSVEWQRGALVERVDLGGESLEHSFRFDVLPARGAIELRLDVATQLRAEATATGLVFHGEQGDVVYREAVAVDAAGRRLALAMQWRDGQVSIAVPAEFVAAASLPLCVDPVVQRATLTTGTVPLAHPDIAYDAANDYYLAVVQREFTATDHDVYAYRLDANMLPISYFLVDITSDDWRAPKVAYTRNGDSFLTVAQVQSGSSRWYIAGRKLQPMLSSTGPQFDIEREGVVGIAGDDLTPDVGGDAWVGGPSWFTVVWSNVPPGGNGDIYFKQVDSVSSALRSTSPTALVADNWYSDLPRISKTNGDTANGRWMVVWRDQAPSAATRHDVSAAVLTWDGGIVPVASSSFFYVAAGPDDDGWPAVSSPAAIEGTTELHFLCAWERENLVPVLQYDLQGAIVSASGVIRTTVDLNVTEGGGTYQAWPQWRPSVDCDGCRFAVAYTEQRNGTLDLDTRVSTFAWYPASNVVLAHESRVLVGGTLANEQSPMIAAPYGRAPLATQAYGIVQHGYTTSGTDWVEAISHEGTAGGGFSVPGGFGCGSLGIGIGHLPAPGYTIRFQLGTAGPLTGFLFGYPGLVSLPICPSCSIGVQGAVTLPNPCELTIPRNPALVGGTFAVQGYSFLGGPCLSSISLSAAIDITVQ